MKAIIRTLCVLTLTVLLLTACGKAQQPASTTDPADTTVQTTTAPAPPLTLVEGGASEYVIYQPKSLGDKSLTAVNRLTAAFRSELGINIKVTIDWGDAAEKAADPQAPAILIGNTSFAASERLQELKMTQYLICTEGAQIVIGGQDDEGTARAIDAFIESFIKGKSEGGVLTFDPAASVFDAGDYPEESYLSCLGEPIEHYRIVIPAQADIAVMRCATTVAAHLTRLTGVPYPLYTDAEATDDGAHEILIGKTARTTLKPDPYSYEIVASGKTLQICADSWYAYEDATDIFTQDVVYLRKPTDITEGMRYSKHLDSELEKASPALLTREGEVRVLIHNIWGNTSSGRISERMLQTAALYEGYAPDVIGLQESSTGARGGESGMVKLLAAQGYTEVPVKISDNNSTPLFYKPATVTLIDSGYLRFDQVNKDDSKGLTWAVFDTVAGGERFAVISTHYWWQSDDAQDTLDRESNARQTLDTVESIVAKYNCPVILGGDFNCNPSSSPYAILTAGGMKDVQSRAPKTENVHTHHTYPTYNEDTGLWEDPVYPSANYSRSIDHIFITPADNATLRRFDVVTDLYALLSSDHCPLIVDFDIK